MTEAPESTVVSGGPTPGPAAYEARPSRLSQALMWVGIVAGVVFVVAVVFFSGFFLGRNSDGPNGWAHTTGPGGMMGPGGMGSGGMMGPGGTGPGGMMGPGGMGPGGMMGPRSQTPTVPSPSAPRP